MKNHAHFCSHLCYMRYKEFKEFMVMGVCTFLSDQTTLLRLAEFFPNIVTTSLFESCRECLQIFFSVFIWNSKQKVIGHRQLFFSGRQIIMFGLCHIKTWNSFFFSTFFCLARSAARERFKKLCCLNTTTTRQKFPK